MNRARPPLSVLDLLIALGGEIGALVLALRAGR